MRATPLILAFILACGAAAAEEAANPDTDAIRQTVHTYVAAYNRGDAAAVASLWSPDAVYLHRDTGKRIEGRDAIAAMFQEIFSSGPPAKLGVTIESIRLLTADVAIEDGVAHVAAPGEEPLDSTYTAVYVKKDGAWLLDSVRETDVPAPPAAAPSNLDELAWLVGEWVDQDENATIHTRYEWAKNKSFLKANFTVSIADQIELEGTQIIGWDAAAGVIRSWVFDSEGGFGEGLWRRAGNQWTVESTSTLSNGSQGSATNVFTRVDDVTFTWKSVDRQLDGEAQPDIDEVPVSRQ